MARPELVVEFRPGASPLYDPQGYLNLGGVNGEYASTSDRVGLDITGDIDIRADLTLTDWAPASAQVIASKWLTTGNQRSWMLYLTTTGLLGFRWSVTGTPVLTATSTVPVDPDDAGRLAVRATIDVDTGLGSHFVTFYVARSIDDPWMQLGAPRLFSSGSTSIFSSTANVEIGTFNNGTPSELSLAPLAGQVHAVEIRNSAGTLVAAPDFRDLATGTTTFADPASGSNSWTVQGNADVVGPEGVPWVSLSDGGPHGKRVTGRLRWRVGRERDDNDLPPGTATVELKSDDRLFDPTNTAGTYFGRLLPRVPFRIRAKGEGIGVHLAGTGDRLFVPDFSGIDVTGDLDVRAHLAADDWTPGGFGGVIVSKWRTTGSQQSWFFGVTPAGNLTLSISTTGANSLTATSTVPLGFDDGSPQWVRVALDADNGAGGRTVTFYTSRDGRTWTQLGAPVTTAGTVTIFNSTASLVLGDVDSAGLPLAGWYHHVEIRAAGNVIVDAPFDAHPDAPGVFTDDTGITWGTSGGPTWGDPADQWYGFVQRGWQQGYGNPATGTVTVELVDLLGVLVGETLPGVLDAAILQFNPIGYWRLDTGQSDEIRDLGSGGNDGTVVGSPESSDTGLYPGLAGAATFNPEDENEDRIDISRSPLLADPFHATVMAVFQTDVTAEPGSIHPLFAQSDGNGPGTNDGFTLYIGTSTSRLDYFIAGAGISLVGAAVSDGRPHIIFGQANVDSANDFGIAVDSATLATATSTAAFQGGNGAAIAGTPAATGAQSDNYFEGSIAAVAVFDGPLTAEAREAIIAGLDALSGQRSDEHVAWLLDQIGVPEHLRNLDEGRAIMGAADTDGRDALDYLRAVTATEQGALFIDHRDRGKVRFRERYAPWLATRSANTQATVSDDPDAIDVARAEAGSLDVQPNGIDSITNRWSVGWRDGEEVVDDEMSRQAYGPHGDSIETEATTAGQARALGQFRLALTKDPRTIIRGLAIRPGAAEDAFPVAIGTRIGDRLTYRSQPQATGSVVTEDFQAEGLEHEVADVDWHVTFFTSTAPSAHQQLFTLGTSELDGPDVLGV